MEQIAFCKKKTNKQTNKSSQIFIKMRIKQKTVYEQPKQYQISSAMPQNNSNPLVFCFFFFFDECLIISYYSQNFKFFWNSGT